MRAEAPARPARRTLSADRWHVVGWHATVALTAALADAEGSVPRPWLVTRNALLPSGHAGYPDGAQGGHAGLGRTLAPTSRPARCATCGRWRTWTRGRRAPQAARAEADRLEGLLYRMVWQPAGPRAPERDGAVPPARHWLVCGDTEHLAGAVAEGLRAAGCEVRRVRSTTSALAGAPARLTAIRSVRVRAAVDGAVRVRRGVRLPGTWGGAVMGDRAVGLGAARWRRGAGRADCPWSIWS